jgi:hypothetical protein
LKEDLEKRVKIRLGDALAPSGLGAGDAMEKVIQRPRQRLGTAKDRDGVFQKNDPLIGIFEKMDVRPELFPDEMIL